MTGLLEVRELAVEYATSAGPPVAAARGVSFDVDAGEAVGLLGESGCGKTTLLFALLGLLPPTARVVGGSIRFRGRDVLAMAPSEMRRLRGAEIAVVFQDPALTLNPVRRVGTQVAEVVRAHRDQSSRRCREDAVAMLLNEGKTLTYDLIGEKQASRCSEVGRAVEAKLRALAK